MPTPPTRQLPKTTTDVVKHAVFHDRPYLKMAFANPYNLSLFLGALTAGVATGQLWLAIAAAGLEAIWLLHGPESKLLRRVLWDPKFEKLRYALEAREREERMKPLGDIERDRVETLVARQHEIDRLAAQNPSFTGDLLRTELMKTHKLVDSFLDLSLTVARYQRYLNTVDLSALERDRERWHQRSANPKLTDQERDIATKNFAVILKRIEKTREIRSYLGIARGQLDLIENSFQLIADQIVTMQSPGELSGQLDDLLDGVESIQQTASDTEKLLNTLEV